MPKQFDFARHWRKRIAPHLQDKAVTLPLLIGLRLDNPSYEPGNPPWLEGRGIMNGQRVKEGCLSWFQPWGRCHAIAPFAWVIGRKLYPQLQWVFDILQFREFGSRSLNPAEDSIAFVKSREWEFCPSLESSFCKTADPQWLAKHWKENPLPEWLQTSVAA